MAVRARDQSTRLTAEVALLKLPRNINKAKKIAVVINPSSAGGRSLAIWPQYRHDLETKGYEITEHTSVSETDFRETVKLFARKYKSLAVCGGDSSLTIAAEELLGAGYRGELLFLPGGSVNDIVLHIREQHAAGKNIFLGEVSCVEDTKQFIGQANWGLGVVVNRWVGKTLRALPFLRPMQNLIGFFAIVFAHLLRREIAEAEITSDKNVRRARWSIVIVSQIKYWASGLTFCPQASYQLPEFEIVTVERCGLFKLIRIILASKNGGHLRFPEVSSRLARSVSVKLEKSLAVQVDGDILHGAAGEVRTSHYTIKKHKTRFTLSTPA